MGPHLDREGVETGNKAQGQGEGIKLSKASSLIVKALSKAENARAGSRQQHLEKPNEKQEIRELKRYDRTANAVTGASRVHAM